MASTIRISKWNINIDLDVITDKKVLVRLSDLKQKIIAERMDLIQKYKIRSKLLPNGDIKYFVAWDSLIEELILKNQLEKIIYYE